MAKQAKKDRAVVSSGDLSESHFGISTKDQAHILGILRDRIYQFKPRALVREYPANGWDAHREQGCGDRPVEVRLPTVWEPALVVRDYGPGLSREGIDTVFVKYGASTKRDSNDPVGTFGIGAKCAFAYNDMFTITSWNGGLKCIYHAFLDETDMGKCVLKYEAARGEHLDEFLRAQTGTELLDAAEEWVQIEQVLENPMYCALFSSMEVEVPADLAEDEAEKYVERVKKAAAAERLYAFLASKPDTETGLEIKVPCNPGDVEEFKKEARWIFPFMRPAPIVNIDLVKLPDALFEADVALRTAPWGDLNVPARWIAIIGCIPYPLQIESMRKEFEDEGLEGFITKLYGVVHFPIGSVDPAVSREGLDFTKRTKEAILAKFRSLREDLTQEVVDAMGQLTLPFERRLRARKFILELAMKPPGEWAQYAPAKVNLWETTKEQEQLGLGGPRTFGIHTTENTYGSRVGYRVEKGSSVRALNVSTSTKIWVKDTKKKLHGYFPEVKRDNWPSDQYLVVPQIDRSVEEVEKELHELIKLAGLEGVPVERLSSRPYALASNYSKPNEKHRARFFVPSKHYHSYGQDKQSDNWDIADREPTEDDITFILERFAVTYPYLDINQARQKMQMLQEVFSLDEEEMPLLMGIKSTDRYPVTRESKIGLNFHAWFNETLTKCLAKESALKLLLETVEWAGVDLHFNEDNKQFNIARDVLGDDHPLVALAMRVFKARRIVSTTLSKRRAAYDWVRDEMTSRKLYESPVPAAMDAMCNRYPLLDSRRQGPGIFRPFYSRRSPTLREDPEGFMAHLWLEYVVLTDKKYLEGLSIPTLAELLEEEKKVEAVLKAKQEAETPKEGEEAA